MAKYRLCGICGKKNPISEGICSCNNLLLNCPILDDEENEDSASVQDFSEKDIANNKPIKFKATKYKQCSDCGHLNSPHLSHCEMCGESLEDVFDLVENFSENDKLKEPHIELSSFHFASVGNYNVRLPIGEYIIGRDEFMGDDITRLNKMYVSSKHLAIKCTEKSVEIMDMSRNGTFLNSIRIPYGQVIPLPVGSILGLGGINEELDPYGYYITLV